MEDEGGGVGGAGASWDGLGYPRPGAGSVSPVTLNNQWPINKRLIYLISASSISILFNGLFIAAFFVSRALKKSGNTFLCCLGLMDMITGGVVPIFSVVVILADSGDDPNICRVMTFLVTFASYAYMILYMFVATENYYQVAWAPKGYAFFNKRQVSIITVSTMLVSAGFAAAGAFLQLDYDYCSRQHYGNMEFRYTTLTFFFCIPFVLTCFYLGYAMIRLITRSRELQYKRSQKHDDEFSQLKINSFFYAIYLGSWTPFMIAIYRYPDTITDQKLYAYSWFGLARSIYVPIFYSFCNSTFRNAYIESFFYCCCKASFPARGQFASRHRRATEYKSPSGDVRVHIMHQMVHPGSPQRAMLCAREGQEL